MKFLKLIAEKLRPKVNVQFTVQIRLDRARDEELLLAMKNAGVKVVCIGYESCIQEELDAMGKGTKVADMVEWSEVFHKYGFFIHAMFIFGYPLEKESGKESFAMSAEERMKRLRQFIWKCKLDTIQVFRAIPLPGTDLWERLNKENRLFPKELVPWRKFTGFYVVYDPSPDGMTLEELQNVPMKVMGSFYHVLHFAWVGAKTTILFVPEVSLRSLIHRDFKKGFRGWYHGWRNYVVGSGGYLALREWTRRYKSKEGKAYLKRLEDHASQKQ
jgi:hypothetical protein